MAATVSSATLFPSVGGIFPARHTNLGPFKSSAGSFYAFGIQAGLPGTVVVTKASDPMSSFTDQTSKIMSSGNGVTIEAMACYQVSDVIHIATQISTGACYYNSFNMATDAWTLTTSENAVATASFAPTVNYTFVDLVVRSNGNVVIAYCAGLTAMSSGLNMVRYRERTGTNTYSTAVNVDNGGSVNWSNPIAVLGASDRVHFFFTSVTNTDLYQRTLSAANALQTFPAALINALSVQTHNWSRGVSFVSGGTTKVRVPGYYADSAGAGTFTEIVAALDSADTPTVSTSTVRASTVSGEFAKAVNAQERTGVAIDGTDVHALYIWNPDSDLYHHVDTGSGFGSATNELAGTLNKITQNVYTRSGSTVLAMVVDDNATLKYAEIALAAAVTTSFPFHIETPLRVLMRR